MTRPCIAVAYSAGRDSTALLHATLMAARGLGLEVLALHVHHGLSQQADAWLAHARAQCDAWALDGLPVRLVARRLDGAPSHGDSVEAWAREARYRALAEMARQGRAGMVLLAHHLRDQAETWLLQALRGAGVAGQSGMPRSVERDGVIWSRPWLDRPRESIDAYVLAHALRHVEDDSNTDPRFARNRLRLQVWPALTAAFPGAEASLTAAATWAQQAADCLDEVASQDLALIADPTQGLLNLDGWLRLSPARRGNALRAWLRTRAGAAPPASLVVRLQQELGAGTGPAGWPWGRDTLRRYRGQLSLVPGPVSEAWVKRPAQEATLSIKRAGRYALPGWQGVLIARRVKDGGIPLAWLAQLELKPRQGGERFQAGLGRPARSLKKQYQAAEVPEWLRAGPLVHSGGQLLFVPGLGIDARVIGLPGQPQLSLDWEVVPEGAPSP